MSTDVDQVTEFVRNGRLTDRDPTWLVIDDWSEAERWAYSQEVPTIWVDLRQNESSKLIGALSGGGADAKAEYDRLSLEYQTVLVRRLRRSPAAPIMDDVIADLQLAALNRLLGGDLAPLFEDMFGGYQAGGWPCGWDGGSPRDGSSSSTAPRGELGHLRSPGS
jgi:hypothetical protein